MARTLIAICVVAIVALAMPASADRGRYLQPERRFGARLDMTSVIFGHSHRGGVKRVWHYVDMQRRWKASMLDGEHRVIHLLFDTWQDTGYDNFSLVTERRVKVFFRAGHLRAKLFNSLGDPPKPLGYVRVRHESSGLTIEVPLRRLSHRHLDSYKWAFMTVFSRRGSKHCPLSHPCIDKTDARHHKYFHHYL